MLRWGVDITMRRRYPRPEGVPRARSLSAAAGCLTEKGERIAFTAFRECKELCEQMKPIEMLAEVLKRGQLTPRERESFEDMYDRVHRFKRCSDKQKAWIEKIFFAQGLDRQVPVPRRRVIIPNWQRSEDTAAVRSEVQGPPEPALIKAAHTQARPAASRQVLIRNRPKTGTFVATPVASKTHQVGYINYPGIQREERVTTLSMFEALCPRIKPGSSQHQKVADFFARGGIVLKVKPLATAQVA